MKILPKILVLCLIAKALHAQNYKIEDGFYTGFDPTKIDENKFEIDASIDKKSKPIEGKYYGYKFGGDGFFLAPEAMENLDLNVDRKNIANQKSNYNHLESANSEINYSVKANIGYEFSDQFKSFVVYDVGNFSLNSTTKSARFSQKQNSSLGLGSQIKINDDFVIKLTYSQQPVEEPSLNQTRLRSDVVRFGTSINF